jgi:hypothetical protein
MELDFVAGETGKSAFFRVTDHRLGFRVQLSASE